MKEVVITSKVVGREGAGVPAKIGQGSTVDLSAYLLKAIWDKVWEIRTDSTGKEYIFGKLPVVTQYGITMYADGGELDLPSIYAGLPIDGTTIYWDGEVLKAQGGGSGGGITDITSSMVVSALGYAPAKASDLTTLQSTVNDFLSGSDTDTIINKWKELEVFLSGLSESDNLATILGTKAGKATTIAGYGITDAYTKSDVNTLLGDYVTLATAQTITGEKNFTGGLKVNGSTIVYDATNKYWKLEGDLLVTGGITMFANESTYTPSTIMDALKLDDTTLGINDEGQLYVKSGTGGGLTEVRWENVIGRPTLLSSFTDDIVAGKYLPLNTSTTNILTSSQSGVLNFKTTSTSEVGIRLYFGETNGGGLWYNGVQGMYLYNAPSQTQLGILNDGTPYYQDFTYNKRHLWHSGNFSPNNYLPLSGGTLTGSGNDILIINRTNGNPYIRFANNGEGLAYFGVNTSKEMVFIPQNSAEILKVLHSGNYNSYALPLSGGTLTGKLKTQTEAYYANDNWGINLCNSDIVGVNSIYFNDLAQDNAEGISFARTNGNWDVLRAEDGVLKFAPDYIFNTGTKDAYTIWHSGNDGSGSGLDADLLDGLDSGAFFHSKGRFWSTYINSVLGNGALWTAEYTPVTGAYNYGTILNFRTDGRQTQFYITDGQQAKGIGGRIFFRDSWNAQETMTSRWLEIITNENIGSQTVSKANQLTTARTIWGQSFDGTGNVNGDLYLNNGKNIMTYNTSGNAYSALTLGTSNNLSIGLGTCAIGQTYIDGRDVFIQTYSDGLYERISIMQDGNVGIRVPATTIGEFTLSTLRSKSHFRLHHNNIFGVYMMVDYNSGAFAIQSGYQNQAKALDIVLQPRGGKIGIGTTTPSSTLDVKGGVSAQSFGGYNGNTNISSSYRWAIYQWNNELQITRRDSSDTYKGTMAGFDLASGNVVFEAGITMYSDQRKKTILNHVELSLKQIAEAPLIEHYYNSDESKTTHVGSIAQYWASLNDWFCKKDNEGFYTMEIQNAALASAISIARELVKYESKTDKKIRLLQKRIGELEEKLKTA